MKNDNSPAAVYERFKLEWMLAHGYTLQHLVAELEKLGIKDEQIWISQERKMCCGLGKCGHCRMGDAYICLDGPVFNYTEGKKLMD